MSDRGRPFLGGVATLTTTALVALTAIGFAIAQTPPAPGNNPNQTAARVERVPLYWVPADRYQVPMVLEPSRRVAIMTTADGVLRRMEASVGANVRDGETVAQLDDAEAEARIKIAQAVVKEKQAQLKGGGKEYQEFYEAQLEAAKAELELMQLARDRCTLRAPFPGKIMAAPVSVGQYMTKGTTVLDLADTSTLRALIPVDKATVKLGATLNLLIDGRGVTGKVQALLPLPESFATLRELANPLTAAWVVLPNTDGSLEPGQRLQSPFVPVAPIANIPSYAIQQADPEGTISGPIIQVIRNEHVANVGVRILGVVSPERTQVSGAFRPADVLITSSSLPLRPGTFLRFNGDPVATNGVEANPPDANAIGEPARITPGGVAPIGSPGPRTTTNPARPAAPKAAPATKGGGVPF